jgi:hypothetical protein
LRSGDDVTVDDGTFVVTEGGKPAQAVASTKDFRFAFLTVPSEEIATRRGGADAFDAPP